MLAPAFVAVLALTLSTPVPAPPSARRRPVHHLVRSASPARRADVPAADANELYSARARGRFASYLRLRLLELREQGLERAADAIRRRLPVDTLLER